MPDVPRDRSIRRPPASGDVVSRGQRSRRAEHDDGPTPEDLERFGNVTRTCPECGKEVFDDVAQCYHCGHAMSDERERAVPLVRVVIVVLVILALLGLGGVALRSFF